MILDHLIAVVPDIQVSHRRLCEAGFEEAWPPGLFWPEATTSGIALGGANLELVQPDKGVDAPRIETVVLAPSTLEEGREFMGSLAFEERKKVESNPDLLGLRGFPPGMRSEPQSICVNLYPEAPPYPFFLCLYAPFLRPRLASANFAQPRGPLLGLSLRATAPETVRRLFVGHLGPIELHVDEGPTEVTEIRFADGSVLSAFDL